jgi:hypothetical protein
MYFKAGIGGSRIGVDGLDQTCGYLRYKHTTPGKGDLCEMSGIVFVFTGYGLNDAAWVTAATRNTAAMNWSYWASSILSDVAGNGNAALIISIPPNSTDDMLADTYATTYPAAETAACIKSQFNPMQEGLAIGTRCAYFNPYFDVVVHGTENNTVPEFDRVYSGDGSHYLKAGIEKIAPLIATAFESGVVGGPWTKRNTRGRRPGLLLPI